MFGFRGIVYLLCLKIVRSRCSADEPGIVRRDCQCVSICARSVNCNTGKIPNIVNLCSSISMRDSVNTISTITRAAVGITIIDGVSHIAEGE